MRNISKLASRQVMRRLVEPLGFVLHFEHHPDVGANAGAYHCRVIYAHVIDAYKAVMALDGKELGDRRLAVSIGDGLLLSEVEDSSSSSKEQAVYQTLQRWWKGGLEARLSEWKRSNRNSQNIITAVLWSLPENVTIDQVGDFLGGVSLVRHVFVLPSSTMGGTQAIVDFIDRGAFELAMKRVQTTDFPGSSSTRVKMDHVGVRLDPRWRNYSWPTMDLDTGNQDAASRRIGNRGRLFVDNSTSSNRSTRIDNSAGGNRSTSSARSSNSIRDDRSRRNYETSRSRRSSSYRSRDARNASGDNDRSRDRSPPDRRRSRR